MIEFILIYVYLAVTYYVYLVPTFKLQGENTPNFYSQVSIRLRFSYKKVWTFGGSLFYLKLLISWYFFRLNFKFSYLKFHNGPNDSYNNFAKEDPDFTTILRSFGKFWKSIVTIYKVWVKFEQSRDFWPINLEIPSFFIFN